MNPLTKKKKRQHVNYNSTANKRMRKRLPNKSQLSRDFWRRPLVRVFGHNIGNDSSSFKRHDSNRTDRNILGSSEESVDKDTDERRVETVLGIEVGQFGVRHRLRDENEADGDTGNEITDEPLQVVVWEPLNEGEKRLDVVKSLRKFEAVSLGATRPRDKQKELTVRFGLLVNSVR